LLDSLLQENNLNLCESGRAAWSTALVPADRASGGVRWSSQLLETRDGEVGGEEGVRGVRETLAREEFL